jgi:hypothetical protein
MPAIANTAPETLLRGPRDKLQKSRYPNQMLNEPAARSKICMNALEAIVQAHDAPIG